MELVEAVPIVTNLHYWGGIKCQSNCFSEKGHVAFQTKGNEAFDLTQTPVLCFRF